MAASTLAKTSNKALEIRRRSMVQKAAGAVSAASAFAANIVTAKAIVPQQEQQSDVFQELKAAQSMSTEAIMRNFMLKQKMLKCKIGAFFFYFNIENFNGVFPVHFLPFVRL